MSLSRLPVQVKLLDARLGDSIPLPHYGTNASAGLDLRACIDEPLTLNPGETHLIPTGMAVYIQNPGYVGLIMPRSGLGHKNGIVLGNLTGVIDADYQGPLRVSLWNRGTVAFDINPGDRIAQFLVVPVLQISMDIVDTFEESARGEGGFGSTGVG